MEDTIKASRRISRQLQVFVFRRDHWLCRWCKKPVIFAPALKYLQQELSDSGYKGLAYWRPAYDRNGAPLLDELAAVIDHVKAFSMGGPGEAANLATACNRCNIRKNAAEAEEWERKHPVRPIKSKYGEPQGWDGLSNVFIFFAKRKGRILAGSEKDWLRALVA
jgi:hypothetical protein